MSGTNLRSVDPSVNKTDTKPCFSGPYTIERESWKLTHILEKICSVSVVSALRKFSRAGQGLWGCMGWGRWRGLAVVVRTVNKAVREVLVSLGTPSQEDPLRTYRMWFYYRGGGVCELSEANNFWSWHWQDVVQSGLLAESQTATSEGNHNFAIVPVPSKNIQWPCWLAVFIKCYFKSQKKGDIKGQAVHSCPSWGTLTAARSRQVP